MSMGHTLSRQQRSPYAEERFFCNLCQEEGCGPLYHCSDCDYDVHVHCAATEKQKTHFTHPQHPLHLTQCSSHARICDSCGSKIHTWSFRCEICDFDMHPTCVRAPRCILHPRHPHPLTLLQQLPELSSLCSGCMMPVNKLSYRCGMCAFNLHQVCAQLPSKVRHLKHSAHALAMQDLSPQEGLAIACSECGKQVQGWHFTCTNCNFNLHPVCANLVHDYLHGNSESPAPASEQNTRADSSAIWAPRDVSDESRDAESSSLPSKETASLPTCTCNPSSHNKSSAATMPPTSTVTTLLHTSMPSPLHTASHIPSPSKEEWEVVQRVLQFVQEMAKVSMSQAAQNSDQSHRDDGLCTACNKGYDCWNPKRRTSCGHHFHLACALECLKRSNLCPICKKDLKIVM